MGADPTVYSRATGVSVLGFVLQLALTLALLLYGVFVQDAAAVTGAFFGAFGLLVWIALGLLFHQHRLERIEAAEAEAYTASGAAAASVFDESADDLRVAARRLASMHRFLTPAVSLVVGVAYLLTGWLRWASPSGAAAQRDAASAPGWAIAIGLLVGAIGFVFARFVAGMAKERAWTLLRGGATSVVGVALIGLFLALGHGLRFAGVETALSWLPALVSALMIAVGAEILFLFVFDLYRPRRRGESPRPAFDSRLLNFIAAPDRIAESISEAVNYQFGFNVSGTWFYQLLARSILGLVALGGLVVWVLSAFVVVRPDERALILTSGELSREVGPGLHVKMPWPIGRVERHASLVLGRMAVGSIEPDGDEPILWTHAHTEEGAGRERYLVVRATSAAPTEGAADVGLLAFQADIHFEVADLRAYMDLAADAVDGADPDALRRELLRSRAERELLVLAGSLSVEGALGGDRESLNRRFHVAVEKAFESAGVRVLFAGLTSVHPPHEGEVGANFHAVVAAQQERETAVERARQERVEKLTQAVGDVTLAERIIGALDELERLGAAGAAPEAIRDQEASIEAFLAQAGGEAAQRIARARSDRWGAHMSARARAARHEGRVSAYLAAPESYLARQYLAALRESVVDARLFITAFDTPELRFDFTKLQSGLDDMFRTRRSNLEEQQP